LLRHILPALVLLRKTLFGLAKRQLPRTLGEIWVKSSNKVGKIIFRFFITIKVKRRIKEAKKTTFSCTLGNLAVFFVAKLTSVK
jgi:hypothetical protein